MLIYYTDFVISTELRSGILLKCLPESRASVGFIYSRYFSRYVVTNIQVHKYRSVHVCIWLPDMQQFYSYKVLLNVSFTFSHIRIRARVENYMMVKQSMSSFVTISVLMLLDNKEIGFGNYIFRYPLVCVTGIVYVSFVTQNGRFSLE